ncbi:MAG TPA: SDR family oxidoreductase [Solirubrobacteraceae bacterium]|nr:SDR family oxidoreductase [Solirubrobacteraceae bacterium]
MPDSPARAAIVTGASRGIGYALAEALGEEGYGLTISARKPDTLEQAAAQLRERGFEVEAVSANLAEEEGVKEVVERHRARYGRLDVLVNNAGVGIGAKAADQETKYVDLQLAVNLRAMILFYRECAELLRTAGSEHRNALVVNLASIAGKSPSPWLSVYSATKAAVTAYTVSMNKEFAKHGVKSVAFAPGWVDTDMTDYVKDRIPAEEMLRPSDMAEALRFLLRVSPMCLVPEVVFQRPQEIV